MSRVLVLAFAATAVAVAAPSVDCRNPQSVGDKVRCAGERAPASEPTPTTSTRRYRFRVAPTEPETSFIAQVEKDPASGTLNVRRIEIFPEKSTKPVQTIELEVETFLPEYVDFLRVEDINFDGYGDLALKTDVGATGNSSSSYWLYDKKTKQFVATKALDDISTVTIDAKRKVLSTFWKGGHAGAIFNRADYRWNGDKLEPVKMEKQEVDPRAPAGDHYVRTIQELKDGKLQPTATLRLHYGPNGEEILEK